MFPKTGCLVFSILHTQRVLHAMLLFTRPIILCSTQVTQRTMFHCRDHTRGTILLQERLFFCLGARISIPMQSIPLFVDKGLSFERLKKLFSHPMHSITPPQGLGLTLLILQSVYDKKMFISNFVGYICVINSLIIKNRRNLTS